MDMYGADDADADAADADADADADAGGSAEGRWHRRGDAGAVEPSAYSRGTRARGFAPTPNFASSVFNVCVHITFSMCIFSVCVCGWVGVFSFQYRTRTSTWGSQRSL